MATALLITGIVVSLVGAGVSAYGQHQSGKAQSAIANFNAMQREKEARQAMMTMQTQAALQKQEAEANFALRSAEAKARENNAKSIESQALAQDGVNRVNLRKRRDDFARLQGEQRAAIAASGVVESSGTPLDLLAETAAKIQQDQEEQHYTNEVERRTLFSEADQERLGGKLALAGATLDRNSSLTAAKLQNAASKGAGVAGRREAEIMRLTGSAARTAANYQAAGTLFSSTASGLSTASTFKTS